MKTPSRFFITLCCCFVLSACVDKDELAKLRNSERSLSDELKDLRDSKAATDHQLEELQKEHTRLKIQLENTESDRNKAEDAIKKLDSEFSDYKNKYKAAVLQKVPGIPLGEFTYHNKQFLQTEVKSINSDSVTLSHPGGMIRVDLNEFPKDLSARLAIDQNTPAHREALSLLRMIAEHKVRVEPVETGPNIAKINTRDAAALALKSVATVVTDVAEGKSLGSGFIARQGPDIFFYTNAHVVSEGTKNRVTFTGGERLDLPDNMEVSDEPEADDLVRFRVTPPPGVPPLTFSGGTTQEGSRIVALGNSGGGGVVPILRGQIKAFGAYALEVDAAVIKGNSGGPVVLEGTSTVVGVVTHYFLPAKHDIGIAGTPFGTVRRICLRPDQVLKWRSMTLSKLVQEHDMIRQIDENSYLLHQLSRIQFSSAGVGGINTEILRHAPETSLGPILLSNIRSISSSAQPGPLKTAARARDYGNLVVELRRLFGVGITGVDPRSLTHFHRGAYSELARQRQALCVDLEEQLKRELRKVQ